MVLVGGWAGMGVSLRARRFKGWSKPWFLASGVVWCTYASGEGDFSMKGG